METNYKEVCYMSENKVIRVHARISQTTNDWLDQKAKEMTLTKSALINLIVESYKQDIQEKEDTWYKHFK